MRGKCRLVRHSVGGSLKMHLSLSRCECRSVLLANVPFTQDHY